MVELATHFGRSIDIIRAEAQISRRSSLFQGLSRMSRYRRANISRNVWGRVTLETGDGSVRLRRRRESPRKCALSTDENINFAERSTMRYGESTHTAICYRPLSVVCCELDRKINADYRPFVLSVTSHTRIKTLPP